MKILILSDIHGNIAALDTVLRERADRVFCLGDLVNYGPYPNVCIEKIRNLTPHITRGNHDNATGNDMDCGCSVRYKELSDAGKKYTKSRLNTEEKSFLGTLPKTLLIKVNDTNFQLSHGSPTGDMYKYLRPDVTDDELEQEIKGINANFVFIGHTHLPMIRWIKDVCIINPGSVGQPRDGIPQASYAVWEDGHIDIKRVSYDIEATVKGLQKSSIPIELTNTLVSILRKGGM